MSSNRFTQILILVCCVAFVASCSKGTEAEGEVKQATKLYWFIPDGMRAEPELFDIYKWAEEGRLPNIKKMMDSGVYGFSKPMFPTHTPVNFATLLTGTTPKVHGVADGPMHIEGHTLNKVSVGGFRSQARKIPAVWSVFEDVGKKVLLHSVPGSTPPEIKDGVVIRGRWGGWGADVHAINFETRLKGVQRYKQGRGSRLFFFGPQLTQYLDPVEEKEPKVKLTSFSPILKAELTSWGATAYAYVYDSSDDKKVNYDRVAFSADQENILADIKQGEWSDWSPVQLSWKEQQYASNYKFHIIKLDEDGFFRLRIFYNNLNQFLTQPAEVAKDITDNVSPMVDFVDNFPPQLIYYPEDKQTFLDELHQSFDYHTSVIPHLMKSYSPDVVIHDIYSPNQMLTSRWWLGYIDPTSSRYNDVDEAEREKLWTEVKDMYGRLDSMIGTIMTNADDSTLIVLSSDHGAHILNKWVRINNYLAKKGYLKFTIDKKTGEPNIDWANSKAIYLKMDGVFIHPDGLAGEWKRGSGEEYEKLRDEVAAYLLELKDEDGTKPVSGVWKWEQAEEVLDLPKDRVGDLIVANKAGYGWNEEMSEDLQLFDTPLKTGYKQAIIVDETKAMWTPFMIMGPGVKKGVKLSDAIDHKDQLPTILKALNVENPNQMEGTILEGVLD